MAGRIPAALRARIGDEATFGLIEALESERKDWSEQVLSASADRFERRLAEELSTLRQGLTQELVTTRVDMLKWSFVFWIGQVAAMAGLLTFTRH
jgi:Spy/CpxP family protein refolding chaperone